jgi:hypothetical protein
MLGLVIYGEGEATVSYFLHFVSSFFMYVPQITLSCFSSTLKLEVTYSSEFLVPDYTSSPLRRQRYSIIDEMGRLRLSLRRNISSAQLFNRYNNNFYWWYKLNFLERNKFRFLTVGYPLYTQITYIFQQFLPEQYSILMDPSNGERTIEFTICNSRKEHNS